MWPKMGETWHLAIEGLTLNYRIFTPDSLSLQFYFRFMTHLTSCLVSALLDLLEKPPGPELLLLQAGGHQEHLLGRGGVIAHLLLMNSLLLIIINY